MLVLRRSRGEQIEIGDSITITIVETSEHYVRIGVDAPRDVKVHRREIADQIRQGKTKEA